MLGPTHVREGLRIVGHAMKANLVGPKRYDGDAEHICATIVEACWDSRNGHYKTSLHNYPIFYSRDFGMCVDSLLLLGHRDRVRSTLAYVLACYARHGSVTQEISPSGKPFNFPDCESPDALAFLLHAIVSLNDKKLNQQYKLFLEQELQRFADVVVDPSSGLVWRGMRLGGMRDYAVRDSSCYDNVMVAAVKQYADALGLKNPLKKYDYKQLLITQFWTGNYFQDDCINGALTGDTNTVPFWFKLFSKEQEAELFSKALAAINASRIAMRETDDHKVSLDQVIATMYQTGLDMQSRYKETSLAGLALNVIEC